MCQDRLFLILLSKISGYATDDKCSFSNIWKDADAGSASYYRQIYTVGHKSSVACVHCNVCGFDSRPLVAENIRDNLSLRYLEECYCVNASPDSGRKGVKKVELVSSGLGGRSGDRQLLMTVNAWWLSLLAAWSVRDKPVSLPPC